MSAGLFSFIAGIFRPPTDMITPDPEHARRYSEALRRLSNEQLIMLALSRSLGASANRLLIDELVRRATK